MRRIKSLKRCHTGKHEYDVSIQLGCLNGCFAFAPYFPVHFRSPPYLVFYGLDPHTRRTIQHGVHHGWDTHQGESSHLPPTERVSCHSILSLLSRTQAKQVMA